MRWPTGRVLWIVGGAVVALLAAWWLRPVPVEVEVAVASVGPLRVTLDEAGRTRVRHHVELSAPVTGRLEESRREVGDTVQRGQVLGRMAPAPLDARARAEAQATVAQTDARTREARALQQQAQVALDEARREQRRAERLAGAGAISPREREQAEAVVRLREGDAEAATARLAAAEDGVRAARAALLGADPRRSSGAAPVPLIPPIAGRVLRLFESDDRVVVAGTPLVEIGDPARLEVVVDVLSRDASRVAPGMRMEVRSGGRGTVYRAVISQVEPAAFTERSALGVDE